MTTLPERLKALAEKNGLMYDDLATIEEAALALPGAGSGEVVGWKVTRSQLAEDGFCIDGEGTSTLIQRNNNLYGFFAAYLASPAQDDGWVRYQELREAYLEHDSAVHKLESLTDVYGENSNRAPVKEARRIALNATKRLRAALAIDTATPPAMLAASPADAGKGG